MVARHLSTELEKMPAHKQVLFIAYLFPPAGGAGVQRTLKFVKFLPQSGWHAIVLTARENEATLQDRGLMSEIPPGNPVHRSLPVLLPTFFPFRVRRWITQWLLLVDEQLGWYPFAVRKGSRLVTNAQALFSTSAPYTNHLVGLRLKRRSGLPWIADFRDPWVGNPQLKFPTRFHRRAVETLEGKVIAAADRILVVSEPVRTAFLERYPHQAPGKFINLPNGYDPDDFLNDYPVEKEGNRFTITYTGSFYTMGRSPLPFFQSLKALLHQGSIPRNRLMVNLVGNIGQNVRAAVQQLGLEDCVRLTGYLDHRKSIGYLQEADLLLLFVGDALDSEAVIPGKVYEYLAANRPILVLGPDGVAAKLVLEAQAGVVTPPNDQAEISSCLVQMYEQWKHGGIHFHPRTDVISRYDRRKQARQLAGILDDLILRPEVR